MRSNVELEREDDGRWIAEVVDLPGVLAYGHDPDAALRAARVVRQPSIDSLNGEDFASPGTAARSGVVGRSDAGVAGPTSRRSNAASGVKDRQEASIEG